MSQVVGLSLIPGTDTIFPDGFQNCYGTACLLWHRRVYHGYPRLRIHCIFAALGTHKLSLLSQIKLRETTLEKLHSQCLTYILFGLDDKILGLEPEMETKNRR